MIVTDPIKCLVRRAARTKIARNNKKKNQHLTNPDVTECQII